MAITVFILDHRKERRAACVDLLRHQKGVRVVGASQSGLEGFAFIGKRKPRILLLDLSLPPREAVRLLPTLRRNSPRTKVLLLSGRAPQARILEALSYGAVGYLEDNRLSALLPKAIRLVNAGEGWVPRKMIAGIVQRISRISERKR